jgi:hypothetical protein
MANLFQNALTLFPSFYSSFFPPNVGPTQFSQTSIFADFLSNAGTNGFGLSQRFILYIESPWLDEQLNFRGTQFDKRLMLRAFSVNVPSKYLSTTDRDIGGPKRKIPYTATFDDDLTVQFYCSPNMTEYMFMQKWVDSIVNPVSRYVSFYDDFAKHTKVTLLFVPNTLKTMDQIISFYQTNSLNGVRFTEVYPRSINANGGTLEWGSNTKPSFVNVSFAFREAVDISTYDDRLAAELQALSEISTNTEPSVKEDTAMNGKVVKKTAVDLMAEKIYAGGKGRVQSATDRLFNFPTDGTPVADNGAVNNYSPPPSVNNSNTFSGVPSGNQGGGGNFIGNPAGNPAGTPIADNGGLRTV